MGYDVHITRRHNPPDKDGPRISEAEWRAYVASDAELEMTGVAEITAPNGDIIRITNPLLTAWRRHSCGYAVWFTYFEGRVSAKNPDQECLAKMKGIATQLNARLQGDEGEFYE